MPENLIDKNTAEKINIEDLLKQLGSDPKKGLTSQEVEKRLAEYGPNEIEEKKESTLMKLLKNFYGPIPIMIELAALLSAISCAWNDFVVIMFLLIMNALIDFFQSRKADSAIAALKASLASKSKALRDGAWAEVEAKNLVPGDIIRLRLGDILPADIKLVDGQYLLVDEAALTGESLPVEKHAGDVAYSGAIAKQGEMNALVYGTGVNTFFGRTAKLVAEAKTKSHFQAAVTKIGQYLIVLNFVLVAVVILDAIFFGAHAVNWWQEITFCLVLTVAAIPVALPAVLSVTMAVGAQKLSKKKAIVSKLVAIEEMAGMDILCSDKTGTITKNILTVRGFSPLGSFSDDDIKLFGCLASKAEDNDAIDTAVIAKVEENKELAEKIKGYEQLEFRPFDPVSKRTEADVKTSKGTIKVSKGAPQVILALAENKDEIKDEITKLVDEAGERGFRTLGVGRQDTNGKWEYVGLIDLEDPPRDDSAATIKAARELGVEVKMITGDHGAIAKETCRQVGIGPNILKADTLDGLADRKAVKLVEESNGFSQVFPEHKYEIVDLLQKNGHIVGMTGDGVNDAPALKKADCGTAVDGATDAAKAAADIVLTDPGLSVIVDAIKESRRIFQRMTSYAIYRIGETIDVLFFTVIAILIWGRFPVAPIMIILLAVFNDFPIMTIATDNVKYSKKPDRWNMRNVIGIATVVGLLDVVFTLALFAFGYNFLLNDPGVCLVGGNTVNHIVEGGKVIFPAINNYQFAPQWIKSILPSISYPQLQTVAFMQLLIAGNFTIFICRTVKGFWSIAPSKGLFLASLISKLIISVACWDLFFGGTWGLIPGITWQYIVLIWCYAFVERMIISDWIKVQAWKVFDHKGIKFHRQGRVHK